MGISAILTPKDLAIGRPVTPGWYPLEIKSYTEEVTKGKPEKPSDGSVNAIFEFECLDGDETVKGRKFKRYFNEKALGFGKSLWVVLFPDFDKEKGGGLNSEMFRSTVGRKLRGYIKMDGTYPTIEDYQPLT